MRAPFWRVLWLLSLVGALAVGAVVVPAGLATSDARSAELPGVYFMYSTNCTFTIENDVGSTVSSIAPGTYNVVVRTPVPFGIYAVGGPGNSTYCNGLAQFQLTGPGVNLDTTVYGGCLTDQEFTATFQPSSSYVAQDNNQPSVTRTVLTTLASGTAIAPTTRSTGPVKGTASTNIVGSALVPLRGTLTGRLTAAGKISLASRGKSVSTLKAGRYKFVIADRDPRGSFVIHAPKARVGINLTGVKFVGKHARTISLKAGRWTYLTTDGKPRSFSVTG